MRKVVRVTSVARLATTNGPALCVLGTAHSRINEKQFVTCVVLANDALVEDYDEAFRRFLELDELGDVLALRRQIRLLVSGSEEVFDHPVEQSEYDKHLLFVTHKVCLRGGDCRVGGYTVV